MAQSSSPFAFPMLDVREIVSALLKMDIEVSENDFKQPKVRVSYILLHPISWHYCFYLFFANLVCTIQHLYP